MCAQQVRLERVGQDVSVMHLSAAALVCRVNVLFCLVLFFPKYLSSVWFFTFDFILYVKMFLSIGVLAVIQFFFFFFCGGTIQLQTV